MSNVNRAHVRTLLYVCAALAAATAATMLIGPGRAAADPGSPVATSPAANAVLARSPSHVALRITPGAHARAGRVVVYDAAHRAIAGSSASRRGGTLVSALPKLGNGVYTVVWHVAGAATPTASSAFAVSRKRSQPIRSRRTRRSSWFSTRATSGPVS